MNLIPPFTAPASPLRPRRTRVILIEPLEQRIAPAVAIFTGVTSDDWNVATNWDIGRVPGLLPADATDLDVVIDLAGTHTVGVNGTFDVKSLTIGGDDRISISGFGTLTLQTVSSFAAGFDIAGGTLNGVLGLSVSGTTAQTNGTVTGVVTNHGTWNWSGGPIGGHFTNASDGIFNLTGAGNKRLQGGTVDNAGMMNISGSGTDVHGNGVYNNLAGGVVNITTDSSIFGTDGSGSFNNSGTVQKTAGAGETPFGDTKFNNEAGGIVSVSSGSLRFSGGGVSTGGTFNVDTGSQLRFTSTAKTWSGTFTGSGGGSVVMGTTINPGVDGLTLNFPEGLFKWGGNGAGGAITMGAGTVNNTGFITLTGGGGSAQISGTIFNNSGTILENDANVSFNVTGGAFNNLATGVFEIARDNVAIDGNGAGHFVNEGTLKKTSGAGEARIQIPFDSQPIGVVDVEAGSFAIQGGGTSAGGVFNAAAGTSIAIRNSPQSWSGTFTGSGQGKVEFYGGTINVGAAGLTLNFPAGLFHWGGNGVGGSTFLTGGTATNVGFITLAGPGGSARINGNTFLNAGTITANEADVSFNITGGSFTNLPTGVFDIQRDGPAIDGDGNGHFINVGEVRKSGGVGEARIQVPFDNGADGVVNVTSGSLAMQSGGTSTGGHFNAAAGTSIDFRGSGHTWSGLFTGSGPGAVQFYSGSMNVGAAGLKLDFPDGVLRFGGNGAGGPVLFSGGTITNLGFLSLAGPGGSVRLNNATFDNAGTVVLNDNDVSMSLFSASFNNLAGAVFDIQRDGNVVDGDGISVFNNAGFLEKSTSAEVTFHTSNFQQPLNNTGTVEVNAGTLNFTSLSNLSGGTLTGGTWRVIDADPALPNTTLGLPQNVATNAATIALDGTSAALPALNTLAANNGTLELRGGRGFTRTGAFSNSGTLSLGPASNFNVTGAFTAGADSLVEFLIGGDPGSGNFGTLTAGGAAALDGTASFTLAEGFGATNGQSFTLATFASKTGAFAAFEGTTLQRTKIFDPVLNATNFVLNAVGDVGDLDVTTVIAPPNGVSGDDVQIDWMVTNNGPLATFTTTWTDSVYLSLDGTFDASDKLLGRVTHNGALAVNGSYNGTLTAPLPGASPGNYRVLVVTDSTGREPDRDRANNTEMSGVIATDVTALTPGVAANGTVAGGEDRWFRVTLPAGATPRFVFDAAAAGKADVYLRQGDTPTLSEFDRLLSSSTDSSFDTTLLTGRAGTFFVNVHGRTEAGAGVNFSLTAQGLDFGLIDVATSHGANAGSTTTTLRGSHFTPETTFKLVPAGGGAEIVATKIFFQDSSTAHATFNLLGAMTGVYDVVATDPAGSSTLDDAFDVTTGAPGKLGTHLDLPRFIRQPFGGAIATITYENTGDTDLIAPLLVLAGSNARFQVPGTGEFVDERLELLATNPDGLAGILPPGAKGTISVPFQPKTIGAHVLSSIRLLEAPDAGEAIDWDAIKNDLRPDTIAADAWDAVFANFTAEVGNTIGSYNAALADNASYLSLLGVRTTDVARLLSFEALQANDFGGISGRYTLGELGRGFVAPYSTKAITDADGSVRIMEGDGDVRFFEPLAGGAFSGGTGETSKLVREPNGDLALVEKTGERIVFRASDGRIGFSEDRNDNRVTATYTAGLLTMLTEENGDVTTFTHNADGLITKIVDPVGRETTFTYSSDHLLTATDERGTTTYTYVTGQGAAREHAIASITFPGGTQILNQYDAAGRLTVSSREGGYLAQSFAYDTAGGFSVSQNGRTYTILPDEGGNAARAIEPLGGVHEVEWSSADALLGRSAPDGVTLDVTRDALSNAVRSVNPNGATTSVSYSSDFNLPTRVTDALGHATNFTYDTHGNVTGIRQADDTFSSAQYDADGNLTLSVNDRGDAIALTYDTKGLLTQKILPGGATTTFTYDAHRNLETATDANGTTTFTYDGADRVESVTYPNDKSIAYTYDAAGRRLTATAGDGFVLRYAYDSHGHLGRLSDTADTTLLTYSYDADGRLAGEMRANGAATAYTYDDLARVESITHRAPGGAITASYEYSYDAAGRVTQIETLAGTAEYTHDAAGQLTGVELPGGREITYAYDAHGNRTLVSDTAAGTTAYAVNSVDGYTQAGAETFRYDAEGLLTVRENGADATTFTYDPQNQLTRILSDQSSTQYIYDALGNRIAVVRDGLRQDLLPDRQGDLSFVFAEYAAGGAVAAHYALGFGVEGRIDAAGSARFFQYDASGSTSLLTDAGGAVLNSYSYLPFGEQIGGLQTVENAFTYNGRFGVQEAEEGLFQMGARTYDASLGRFLQQDPLGFAGADTNLYRFVGNNPLRLMDPTGLDPIRDVAEFFLKPPPPPPPPPPGTFLGIQPSTSLTELVEGGMIFFTDPFALWDGGDGEIDPTAFGRPPRPEELPELAIPARTREREQPGNPNRLADKFRDSDSAETQAIVDHLLGGGTVEQIFSGDPNNIIGPRGLIADPIADDPHTQLTRFDGYVNGDGDYGYQILFENMPSASAPAQFVEVTQTLDANLDPATLRFTSFGWGDMRVDVPANQPLGANFTQRVDARDTYGIFVDVAATIDTASGALRVTFTSVDPVTGDLPLDPFGGFLPPNVTPPEGDGFVNYTVQPDPGLALGTDFDAQATIIFDLNESIDTPLVTNTIAVPPVALAVGKKRTFTDSDGDLVTVSYSGPGAATLVLLDPDGDGKGPVSELTTTGSTTKSKLTVSVKKGSGDGAVSIEHVDIGGALGSFSAKSGDLGASGFNASGAVKSIVVRDLFNGASIHVNGAATEKTAISVRFVANDFLVRVPGILSALTAAGIGEGEIQAAALAKLNTTAGGMDADLVISGTVGPVTIKGGGVNAGNWAGGSFGTISVTGGALDADIDSAGAIAKITVKGGGITGQLTAPNFGAVSITDGNLSGLLASTTPAATLSKTAALKSLAIIGGDLAGDVRLFGNFGALSVKASKTGVGGNITGATFTAAKFGNVAVAKDVTNAILLAGADLGTDFALGGATDTFAAGAIGTVKIGGMMTGAIIGAGLATTDSILGNGDDEILGGTASSIAGLAITGAAAGGSSISAGLFKGKPKIEGIVATPAAIPGGFRLS